MRRLLAGCLAVLAACSTERAAPRRSLPEPPREFRAAWVATVANIDWPSSPTSTPDEQRAEAIRILDRLVGLRMNAVVLQVRPHADALYASELEPWSAYLTGEQGKAPEPSWDPLRFWVDEAHRRGLQLHAWFNPYRANHPAQPGACSADWIGNTHPDLVVPLGSKGYSWLVPTDAVVQDHVVRVVLDVVRRYDVDGVHFDDYFYPYASYNDGEDFPDAQAYAAATRDGFEGSRGDWRRAAVDGLIERLGREIHEVDRTVAFGISPFGIWRPEHPPSIRGLDAYDALYADARRWLREGWVDYLTPQLYWPIAQVPQSFPVLLGWWHAQNAQGRHVWPGTSIGRIVGRDPGELVDQIMITRGMAPEDAGICMFSMKVLMRDDDVLGAKLVGDGGPYAADALIPASEWLAPGEVVPAMESVTIVAGEDGRSTVRWRLGEPNDAIVRWVAFIGRGGADDERRWSHRIGAPDITEFVLERPAAEVWIAPVDRAQRIGVAVRAALPTAP